MTKSQRRFAAALERVGYTTTEAVKAAVPTSPTAVAPKTARARHPVTNRYAADAHPWAHDEE